MEKWEPGESLNLNAWFTEKMVHIILVHVHFLLIIENFIQISVNYFFSEPDIFGSPQFGSHNLGSQVVEPKL